MKVSVILKNKTSQDVATIAPTASVGDAVRLLADHGIGALVVKTDDDRIAGIISERDVVRLLGEEGPGALDRPIDGVMTAKVECCVVEDTALELLARMTEGRFRHMPVQGADGRMIGILSIGDVVKARLDEMAAENAAMADMLSH